MPPAEVPTGSTSSSLAQDYEAVCPICQRTKFKLKFGSAEMRSLNCKRCDREFPAGKGYVDLTLTAGVDKDSAYTEASWLGTETFRRPTVSSIYERGWRQGFAWAGFPGVDTEFGYAMDYLQPQTGEVIVDMSCGSGLFTRRFAKSGLFKAVIASDFSESMLEQTNTFIREDTSIDADKVALVRADVARLPFETGSISAIHAGAAIHCWPNPTAALAEISRVLKPGGLFVGSTFLDGTAPLGELLGNDKLVAPLKRIDPTTQLVSAQYKWWSEDELRDLFASVGLRSFRRQRSFRFILWSVQKPPAAESDART